MSSTLTSRTSGSWCLAAACANNLNQVAVHANTYGIYPSEITALQKDYANLWEPLSELLKKLSAVVSM